MLTQQSERFAALAAGESRAVKMARGYLMFCIFASQAVLLGLIFPVRVLLGKPKSQTLLNSVLPIALKWAADLKQIAVDRGMARQVLESERNFYQEAFVLVQGYGANPQPERIPEILDLIDQSCAITEERTELPAAGAVLALIELRPELAQSPEFEPIYKDAMDVLGNVDQGRAGWNDFYMARWFVLRGDTIVRELARRTTIPGMVGSTATWMVNSVASQLPEFRAAVERIAPEVLSNDGMGRNVTSRVGPSTPGAISHGGIV
jgi:hypothetical protein